MFEIPKLGDEDTQYDGSRIFTWLADMCGLSVDLVSIAERRLSCVLYARYTPRCTPRSANIRIACIKQIQFIIKKQTARTRCPESRAKCVILIKKSWWCERVCASNSEKKLCVCVAQRAHSWLRPAAADNRLSDTHAPCAECFACCVL